MASGNTDAKEIAEVSTTYQWINPHGRGGIIAPPGTTWSIPSHSVVENWLQEGIVGPFRKNTVRLVRA